MNIKPSEIIEEVRQVLLAAARGKGTTPNYLTAYQILNRLPAELRSRLVAERGRGGKGEGVHYAAASVVSDAAELVERVEIGYLDTGGLQLIIDGQPVEAGNRVCGLYRILV